MNSQHTHTHTYGHTIKYSGVMSLSLRAYAIAHARGHQRKPHIQIQQPKR